MLPCRGSSVIEYSMLSLPIVLPPSEADPLQTFSPSRYAAAVNRLASILRKPCCNPGFRRTSSSREFSKNLAMYSNPSWRNLSLSRSVNCFLMRRLLDRTGSDDVVFQVSGTLGVDGFALCASDFKDPLI